VESTTILVTFKIRIQEIL